MKEAKVKYEANMTSFSSFNHSFCYGAKKEKESNENEKKTDTKMK